MTTTSNSNQVVENGKQKDDSFREVIDLMFDLQSYKARHYGSSWCKHGEAISIFGNISRKYDRLEQIIKNNAINGLPLPSPLSEESVAETAADLAVYSILWMTWIKVNRPIEFNAWKERIAKLLESASQTL
jgi:hypothetical protein